MLAAGDSAEDSIMRRLCFAAFCAALAASPALAEPMEAGDPLAPCLNGAAAPEDTIPSGSGWAVEIASSFNKQESLDDFSQAQKDYSDVLGDFSPTVVAVCDLSMGTDLRYSARVVFDKRDAADKLCDKLQAAGGACIVSKN
jgi:hypothetical protein